jgi:TonB-dependent receptor
MRLKSVILSSTSLAVFGLAATPAAAQTAPAPQAQEGPADIQESGAGQSGDTVETGATSGDEIVVTGFRESLRSAQNIKRNSEQIVDAIVAEDIGKLPDIAVSDTAARIPGIQVERSGGEASRVLLRGLDRIYYTTTYNGREIFTAETRSVALQDFPAGGISAIEAFKTSSANLVEPGIAGLLNVRSRRPFDFRDPEIAGSVWGVYPSQSQDLSGNAQLLLTDRWDTGIGEIGALINVSYTSLHYRDSTRRHAFFIANLAGGRSPDWPQIVYGEAERSRPSINGALQWRPSPGLEFYAEGLWQGFNEDSTDRLWEQPLWGGDYSNIVLHPGTDQIVSGTVFGGGGAGSDVTRGYQGATKRRTNTYQFAVGGSYDAGPLRISADLAHTTSRFKLRTESIDYQLNTTDFTVNWFTGRPGGRGFTMETIGIDPSDPDIYEYRGFFEDYLTAEGDDWQARLDFRYETGMSALPSVEWGVRYVSRDASRRRGDRYWYAGNLGVPISDVPLDYRLFQGGFRGDEHRPTPYRWLAPTFDSVWANLQEFRQFNVDLTGLHSIADPAIQPSRSFDINETSYAGYAQLNYEFAIGEATVNGAIGMRAVRTEQTSAGTLITPDTGPGGEPIAFDNEYTDWLPNANLTVRFNPEWQLRLAATQTRTRPQFEQLNPALNLSQPDPDCDPEETDCVRTGSGGNPFLRPFTSNNYDASLEYYFSSAGFASVAAFRRDIRGFIVNRAFEFPDPDPETGLPLLITGPVNTNKARISGFEAQFSTFFDYDFMPNWARAFGIQANATYIDAKADYIIFGDDNPNQSFQRLRIPDVSRWTYNLVGMYEAGGLSVRLSYNKRTGFAEGDLAERDGFFTLQGRGNSVSRLDWSSSYAVNENLTFFFDWTNILGDPFQSDIVRVNYPGGVPSDREIFPMVTRFEESVVSTGIRFRF